MTCLYWLTHGRKLFEVRRDYRKDSSGTAASTDLDVLGVKQNGLRQHT